MNESLATRTASPPGDAFSRRPAGPFEIVRRDAHPEFRSGESARVVAVGVGAGAARIGGDVPVVIAGPCAVESREQTLSIARACAAAGASALRGGAFKPRTSPYDFQGLGEAGLRILADAREATGLPVVTEALDPRHVGLVAKYADAIQIGARNMQNVPLIVEAARTGKPLLLKRHWAATMTEWLAAAEYAALEGNLDVILCERGIRTFSQGSYNRSTLDLNVVQALRRETFLPVVVDPSHGTGVASLVAPASLAAVAAGAHGLLIEVIGETTDPDRCLCDGFQSIRPSELARIARHAHAWSAPDVD